jgi:hypothetical protein
MSDGFRTGCGPFRIIEAKMEWLRPPSVPYDPRGFTTRDPAGLLGLTLGSCGPPGTNRWGPWEPETKRE